MRTLIGDRRPVGRAGNAIVDGIAASNYVIQEDHGFILDAAESERFKSVVRSTVPHMQT